MKKLVCTLAAVLLISLFCASALAAIPVNANVAALIGEDGTVIVEPGEYAQFIDFGMPGLFAAQTPDGKFLIVDETGTCRGDATYDYLENVNGTILYARGEKYGVLDAELNELVPCEYTWLVSNGEGGFLALRTDIWDDSPDGVYLIDESGYVSPTGVKIASILWPFSGGMSQALSVDNGRYGYLNADGQWQLQPQYAYADQFVNGLAVATLDSGSGMIDTRGNWRIMPKYDFIDRPTGSDGLIAAVKYNELVDVFRASDQSYLYTLTCDTVGAYTALSGKILLVFSADSVRAVNETGKTVLEVPASGSITSAGENRLFVYPDEWGAKSAYLADIDGKQLSDTYQNFGLFATVDGRDYFTVNAFDTELTDDGLIWLSDTMRCGLIDEDGREILPIVYSELSSPAPGYIQASDEEGVHLLKLDGTEIWSYRE
ncbi:MAG: WG repeat-containing protein [Eubacteriales bacterium]|nr:WG repeat-containing protein [Eubacteriales bacterium]